jgi:hypothetical protein
MKYFCMTIVMTALALPAAAIAGTPNTNSLANNSCKAQQTAMGATFKAAYGTNADKSNAFGKCVAKATVTAAVAVQNAAKSCKAQQADANFANTASNPNHLTFDAFYGANGKGKSADANALGKCVSKLTQQSTNAQTKADVAAAKACKTELAASKTNFAGTYGAGKNAFGVCVSRHSKL